MSLVPPHLILQHPPLKCWEHGCAAPHPQGLPAVFLKVEGSFQVWDPSPIANSTDNKSRGETRWEDGKLSATLYRPWKSERLSLGKSSCQ